MPKKIRQSREEGSGSGIVKTDVGPSYLRFSFKFFDPSDAGVCPGTFPDGYVRVLMERLKQLEGWNVRDFTGKPNKTLRNHTHDWAKTNRPEGFVSLPPQWQDYPGWQFCLTANQYGRVHGVIKDEVFYVVWLDRDHNLYP